MDYTSIHIYGHLLSDDILHNIERDNTANTAPSASSSKHGINLDITIKV